MPKITSHWKCPKCGAGLSRGMFGNDIAQNRSDYKDLFGTPITQHLFGNCNSCWEMVEIINGQVARSLLLPIWMTKSDERPDEE